jgi:hypothetical protein
MVLLPLLVIVIVTVSEAQQMKVPLLLLQPWRIVWEVMLVVVLMVAGLP